LDAEREQVVVNEVFAESPAQKAGLKKDDVVLKVAGGQVTTLRSAVEAVRRSRPRTDVVFHIRRDGKELDITAKVGVLPFSVLAGLD
jgi:serine protease DegS